MSTMIFHLLDGDIHSQSEGTHACTACLHLPGYVLLLVNLFNEKLVLTHLLLKSEPAGERNPSYCNTAMRCSCSNGDGGTKCAGSNFSCLSIFLIAFGGVDEENEIVAAFGLLLLQTKLLICLAIPVAFPLKSCWLKVTPPGVFRLNDAVNVVIPAVLSCCRAAFGKTFINSVSDAKRLFRVWQNKDKN